jgi:hypothetical protein
MLQKAGVIKISDKKKELKSLKHFILHYHKIFHEYLFPKNCHLECSESPDFIVEFDNQKIGIEITETIHESRKASEKLEDMICENIKKYLEEEDIKIDIWLFFSDSLASYISKRNQKTKRNEIKDSQFIKDFTEEYIKYIIARRNREYSSFEEFCESNKNSLICKYLVGEPIVELYSEKLKIREGEGGYVSINYYKKKLPEIINKKIDKLSRYRKKVDKIYLLIITSCESSKDLYFLANDIENVREILNSYTKGENNFDKIFLYNENYYNPHIIKSD